MLMRVRRRWPRKLWLGGSVVLGLLSGAAPVASASVVATRAGLEGGPVIRVAWLQGRQVRVTATDGQVRTVARLRSPARYVRSLTVSPDGRHVSVATTAGVWILPVAGGGRARRVSRESDAQVRWAPRAQRALVVDSGVRRCDLRPALRCRVLRSDADTEFGASWSPGGSAFAYVRRVRHTSIDPQVPGGRTTRFRRELVAVTLARPSRTRVIDTETALGGRGTVPTPPVWTRRGVVWTRIHVEDPGSASAWKASVLRWSAPGRVRELAHVEADERLVVPLLTLAAFGSTGVLAGQYTRSGSSLGALTVLLLRFDGRSGRFAGPFPPTGAAHVQVQGVLRDGRVALERFVVNGAGRTVRTSLHLVRRGARRLGRAVVVSRADNASVAIALPYPNEAAAF